MTPLIPYANIPELVVLPAGTFGSGSAPLSLKPFGLLVATGVYLGAFVTSRYANRRGVSPRAIASFVYWVVGIGFIGGHVLDVLFYSPERLKTDPWAIVRVWDGLSSFGGFIGGSFGALLWRMKQRVRILPYADLVASGLPLGWVFGRAGCAVVHDHPGLASDAWYAVAFPSGGRLGLGLIEMGLTVPLAIAFLLMQRRAWPWGFFLAVLCCAYAPVRFVLDFLRIRENVPALDLYADRRIASLTPAQWASIALFAFGVWLLRRVLSRAEDEAAFRAPAPPPALAAPTPSAPN
jgi:phosphatidylglycerol:prolipoprotein diacylglycerol transferase